MYYSGSSFITTTVFVLFSSKENALLLSIGMDFFDKLKSSLASPLKGFQGNRPSGAFATIKASPLPVGSFSSNHIRVVLFRDCDRRGRKCLYDSQYVIKDRNGKISYVTATGSTGCELKNLSEYIFGGCVRLRDGDGSKRFHKYDGKYIWSKTACPKPSSTSANNTPSSSGTTTPCNSGTITPCKEKTKPVLFGAPTPMSQSAASSTSSLVQLGCDDAKITRPVNSLPIIMPSSGNCLEKSFSLPSNLQVHKDPQPKTHLGLAIIIETTPDNTDVIGPYLQSLSQMMEECVMWFSSVATKAYRCPGTFVQTLFDFTTQVKNLLFTRLSYPIVSPMSLTPNWKALPALTAELIQLILEHDERHCRLRERIKLVLIGGGKRISEVAALLYLFKILMLQCTRSTDTDFGIDATTFCKDSPICSPRAAVTPTTTVTSPTKPDPCHARRILKFVPFSCNSSGFNSMSSSSAGLSISSTAVSMSSISSSITSSPPVTQPALVSQISFTLSTPQVEKEQLQGREYDSGIDLESESSVPALLANVGIVKSASMRRSVSQKFDSGCGSSTDEPSWSTTVSLNPHHKGTLLLPPLHSHEYEEVTFHLGDPEQSFNTLALSEPNLDKLKINHGSPIFIEPVESNTKVEKLPSEPVEVKLKFGPASTKPLTSYCPYCDSIGVVSTFSPLYYIQWVKTSCCSPELSEENFNLMKSFSTSKFIVVNLDKSLIRTINFDPSESYRTKNIPTSCNSNNSTSLVSNLVYNLQLLAGTAETESREDEIEHFLRVQLDFIRKIAHEFGESWGKSHTGDACLKKKYSYLSLSDADLKLIYSLARMKYPNLASSE